MADQTINELVNAAPVAASLVPYSESGTTYCATMTQLLGAPAGIIGMWSGTVASIPTGWALCDGQSGRPDLRNKFVVGAGNSYAVNAGGGNKDAIVVSHTHTGTVASHSHTGVLKTVYSGGGSRFGQNSFPTNSWSDVTGYTLGNTGASSNSSASISTDGSSGTNANLPPYYALCYIVKT
jgi:microcystin-dependent protein